MNWEKIDSKLVFNNPRLKVYEDLVKLPNGIKTNYLHFGGGNGGVMIICIDGKKVLIQEEYSYPINETLLQFPGGRIEKDETPEEAAKREMIEESGIKILDPHIIGFFYPNNRRSASKVYLIEVNHSEVVQKIGGDNEEDIKTRWISISDFEKILKDGKITNASMLSGWALFKSHMK